MYRQCSDDCLFDTVSSTHSLSVLLSAMEISRTTPGTSLLIVVRNSLAVRNSRMRKGQRTRLCMHYVYHIAVATIQGRCIFCSELLIVWLLYEGGIYLKKYSTGERVRHI